MIVVIAKAFIGLRSGSIAVLGDAAHSGVDALNNVVALSAVRLAAEPPDEEHPYGHGKFETIGALAVVSFLSITVFELVRGAITRLVEGSDLPNVDRLTFTVLALTMVVNIAVAGNEAYAARKYRSEVLAADARHTAADVLVTVSVLGGLLLVWAGWKEADAWLGIIVAGVIAKAGYDILADTIPVLVDTRAMEPGRIERSVREVRGVIEVAEIRSRGRPGEAFAELTIRVDPGCDVVEAHRIADEVESLLEAEGGFLDVVVHVEPAPDD